MAGTERLALGPPKAEPGGRATSPTAAADDECVRCEGRSGLALGDGLLFEVVGENEPDDTTGALAARPRQIQGEIRGAVLDSSGQPVQDARLELSRPSDQGPGRLVATTASDGTFAFPGLYPGRYEVALVVGGRPVTSSGPIELSGDMMSPSGVTLAFPAGPTTLGVPRRPRTTAVGRRAGRPFPTSFEALEPILLPGFEVVVRDGEGRATRGRVVSISADAFVVVRRRFLFRRHEETFAEDAVRRIDVVDPLWNGLLIGAIATSPALVWGIGASDLSENLGGLPLFWGVQIFTLGALFGGAIDDLITAPIYERPPRPRRVSVVPLVGGDRRGLVARIAF